MEDDCSVKTYTQIVAALEVVPSHLNKESSIKEIQEEGEINMINFVINGTTQTILIGYSNALGNNTPQ